MGIIDVLVDRSRYLGRIATKTGLAPATVVPDGCTVYVIDEAKIYTNINGEWVIWPSDTSFVGVYEDYASLPEVTGLPSGAYAFVEETNKMYYILDDEWTAPIGTVMLYDAEPFSSYYSNPLGDFMLKLERKREDDTLLYESKLWYYPSSYIAGETTGIIKIIIDTLKNEIVDTEFIEVDDATETIRELSATREADGDNNVLTILLAVEELVAASGVIGGSTANGHVDMIIGSEIGEAGNDITFEVDGTDTSIRDFDISYTDGALVITLKVVEDTPATAIIGGATVNGHIDMEIDGGIGVEGNEIAYEVDADDSEIRSLDVSYADDKLSVALKVVEDTYAEAIIGGATVNGHVDMQIAEKGADGNNYTINVDGDTELLYMPVSSTVVRDMSVSQDEKDITVNLKILPDAKATGEIGTGVNSHLNIEAANAGYLYNYVWVGVDGSGAQPDISEIRPLSVEEELATFDGNNYLVTNNKLLIKLAVEEKTAASAVIGNPDNDNGHIDVVIVDKGAAGNDYTFIVTIAEGLDQPLSVTQDGTVLSIELGTDVDGYVSLTKNTCTLVAAAIDAIVSGDFDATADGTGAEPLTYEQPSTSFSGGENQLEDAANTCTFIAAAINGTATMFVATPDGDGSGSITAWDDCELSGGTDKVDDTASGDNSAGNVATELNDLASGDVVAIADGDGSVALVAEAIQSFSGGANKVDDTASGDNSAGSIASEINNLPDCPIIATADGDGSVAITSGEVEANFANGANKVDDTASGDNSAGSIASEINNLPDCPIIATADGNGSVAITSTEAEDNFAGGTQGLSETGNATDVIIAAIEAILVEDEQYYSCEETEEGVIDQAYVAQIGFDGEFYNRVEKYYDLDGESILLEKTYSYTYDDEGNLTSEVLE